MDNSEAKALLKRIEHGLKYPRTTTESVIVAAHGELVAALEAALAREDAGFKAPAPSPLPRTEEPSTSMPMDDKPESIPTETRSKKFW